jgi:uncharacterized protein YyaL (SSP411 family)
VAAAAAIIENVPNRLAAEHSPYLLQHQDNPVDWYPWGAEAFERARSEDKPIFLSIGYSTCHWCHVMEHESFESRTVSEVLNRHFVPIKVDREERPDVDRVYMSFVQATTGSGGWPMSVWLTPSLQPFYGGTYFPPSSKWGRPGFIEILKEIARAWEEDRGRIETSAETITERLRTLGSEGGTGREVPAAGALDEGVRQFAAAFDARRGGFGDAPKFPRPSELLFLLREHARTGPSRRATWCSSRFARWRAADARPRRRRIPSLFRRRQLARTHFEKMLYDQAQLVLAYVEAAQLSGDAFFADVAADSARLRRARLRPTRAADSIPRKTQTAFLLKRRTRETSQDGGRVLHLARRGDYRVARQRCGHLPHPLRRAAGRQRAVRSAE